MNKQRLLERFYELVQIDSETKNERAIADYLLQSFDKLEIEAIEDDSASRSGHGAGNIIATIPGTVEGDYIYFTSHMDTVTPGVHIQPTLKEDGYIYSDGTTILGADDKAGLAALFEMLEVLREQKIEHGPFQLVITAGEESGLRGAKAMDPTLLKADYGYAVDSTGKVGGIVNAAPYQTKIAVRIEGKTAHAGVAPEKGISAITVAAKCVAEMKLGRIDDETTANIGKFHGGEATNIVCDEVHILAEARSINEQKMENQVTHMKETFERVALENNAKAIVETTRMYPGFSVQPTDRVIQTASRAIHNIGREVTLMKSGGGSDGNIFNGAGVPTVTLSVGYEHIHTTNERMPVEELEKLTELLIEIVQEAKER